MKKLCIIASIFVCLLTATARAQDPRFDPTRTVIMDVNIAEVSLKPEELQRLWKEKGGLNALIEGGTMRPIASVQLRGKSGRPVSTRIGQRVPVQGIATSTVPQPGGSQVVKTSTPAVQYENTGLLVVATPMIGSNGDIEVTLRIELSAVDRGTGTMTPTFIQRTIDNAVRVKPGEPTLLLGVVQHESLWPVTGQAGAQPRGSFVVVLNTRIVE